MSVFAQDGDGDLLLTNGQLTFVEGANETAIRLRNRLYCVKGEWFADARIGIPYVQLVFIKNPNMSIIRNMFERAFREVPGVLRVETLELDTDADTRNLQVTAEIRHDSGALISGGSGDPFIVETI